MTLIPDWKTILGKAWSVRFIVISALLSGLEVALPIMRDGLEPMQVVPPGTFAILSAITTAAALIARIVAQPSIKGPTDGA